MMKYNVGDKIKYRMNGGHLMQGIVIDKYELTDFMLLKWTKYDIFTDDGFTLKGVAEIDLVPDLTSNYWGPCECGSVKLGHPGHSSYCNKFVK